MMMLEKGLKERRREERRRLEWKKRGIGLFQQRRALSQFEVQFRDGTRTS